MSGKGHLLEDTKSDKFDTYLILVFVIMVVLGLTLSWYNYDRSVTSCQSIGGELHTVHHDHLCIKGGLIIGINGGVINE